MGERRDTDPVLGTEASDAHDDTKLRRLLVERSAALSALAEAEERWRLILETAQDAFVGANEAGEIVDWNERAEEIFGWSAADIVGRPLAETIIPPAYREAHRRGLRRFLETGEGPLLFQRIELPALHRDGHEFDVEITIWPSRSGDRYRFNAFLRDISLRKRAGAHMRLLQRVAEAANGAPTVEDAVRSVLAEVCTVTRWPVGHAFVVDPGEARGLVPTGWWHLASEQDFAAFRAATRQVRLERGVGLPGRVLETGEPAWISDLGQDDIFPRYRFTDDVAVRSGFAFPVLVGQEVVAILEFYACESTRPDPELLTVMGNVGTQLGRVFERDRTAQELQRTNRELQAAVELKSRFVSIVSHELRSPLSAILGFAALMDLDWEDLDEDDKRNYVRSIERQSRRLNRLVEDLLMVSRLETGTIATHPTDFEVCEVIEQAIGDLNIAVTKVDCSPGTRVQADKDHVTQMLVNFLTNAVRYGAPPIRLDVEPHLEFVDVRVCDAGPGIEEGFLPRLFQPFARARGVKSAGTGLGLSIVRGLARANGGDSWYEPGEPRGACFVVRLPAARGRPAS
ncbi:MAG: PAS domain S-box protein [Nitriliruptorales bacterium]